MDLRKTSSTSLKPGEEIVGYRDLGECAARDFHLAHPAEARAIGENARRRALMSTRSVTGSTDLATVNDRFGNFARP